MTHSCHWQQLIKSVATLVALVAACIFVDVVLGLKNQPVHEVSKNVIGEVVTNNKTAKDALEEYPEYLLSSFSTEVPQVFKEECFDVSEFQDLYIDENGGVISFCLNKEQDEACSFIKRALEEKGWAYVESGVENKTTFMKTSGSIRWLFVEVYSAEAGSVVLLTTEGSFDE